MVGAYERLDVLGGPPYFRGMDLGIDFTRGALLRGASYPADTHSGTILMTDRASIYRSKAANVLCREDGVGLQTVPTRTNLFANTSDLDTYLNTNADKVSITHNQPDPAGTANGAATFTVIGANEGRLRNITVPNDSATYELAFWVKKTTGTPANYPGLFSPLTGGTGGASIVIVVNTTAGTANSSGALGNLQVVSDGDFWRVSWTVTNNSSGNTTLGFRLYPAFNLNGSTTFNGSATGSAVFAWPQIKVGSFFTPPILTTGSTVTVNGNQQIIDLTGKLASGVGGIMQVNVLETGSTLSRLFELSDGTGNNVVNAYMVGASNKLVFGVASGGVASVTMDVTTPAGATGLMTVAFAASTNYAIARVVGQTAPAADTSVTYPAMSQMSLLGRGSDAARNSYGLVKRLALKYGAQDATTFAALYARAERMAVMDV